jgi:DNA-binding LacI/PurR family transcriptional regulator
MKVTLQDISRETGFSVSTVSRVLGGSKKISATTRNRIIETAKRLQYPLSRIRNAPTSDTTLNIALITDFHEGEFYASYFSGFARAAPILNIRLSLLSLNNPRVEIPSHLSHPTDRYYDGAVLFIPEFSRAEYQDILKRLPAGFPILSNAIIESPVVPTITFDGYGGGTLALHHFKERGYRTVGLVKGPANKAESSYRTMGFRDACHRSNGEIRLTWEFQGDYLYHSGVDAFRDWWTCPEKPQAVFVANDLMATGLLEAARVAGVRIPEDLAILGYDDLPMCRHSQPDISSIRTDFVALAQTTLRVLKERITDPDHPTGIQSLIPVSLAHRSST